MALSQDKFSSLHAIALFYVASYLAFPLLFSTIVNARMSINHNSSTSKTSSLIPAIFVFGDSSVDSGNNNYLKTNSKGDYPPYGKDFIGHRPNGRFSNGKIIPDLVASYLGIKELVPPYLDPTLSTEELITGVCFASGGTGYDPVTARLINVIAMQTQLENFQNYKTRLEAAIGKNRTEDIIKRAIYVTSCGSNDLVFTYFTLPFRRQTYSTVEMYQHFILQNMKNFIQGLVDQGARRLGIAGLPPLGCMPVAINLNSQNPFYERNCIAKYTSAAVNYNKMLQVELANMQKRMEALGVVIKYVDIYTPLMKMIQEPNKYGFEDVNSGCCGSGAFKVSLSCDPYSYVCPDAAKYVFWDSIHPTERSYSIIFKDVLPMINALVKSWH